RCRALLLPPVTGNYVLWVSSDDASDLYLSSTENPANKTRIAFVSAWTSPREWSKEANQQSAPIALQGGSRYYIEALMKEGGGGDNLAVRWQLPGGAVEEPIPASRLIAFTGVATQPPVLAQQPASVSVTEGGSALFQVQASNGDPVTYQ